MGGGLERVRSISSAPKTDVTSTSPPVSHNFAPSLPMTSLENAPLPRPGSLALGLTPALCSPCRPRSTLLVREFVTVTVTAGSIKIAKAHPGLAFSPRVQCNQLCFERGRPLQGRPRVLARVVPNRAAPPASTRALAAAQRPLFVEHARHSAARWHRRRAVDSSIQHFVRSFEWCALHERWLSISQRRCKGARSASLGTRLGFRHDGRVGGWVSKLHAVLHSERA